MSEEELRTISYEIDLESSPLGRSLQEGLFLSIEKLISEWRKRTVLVLGFTGAGKTSLLKHLFGITEPDQDQDQPTTQVNEYIFKLGDTKFKAADTPGHPTLRALLDAEIDSLVRGDYQGVINVVSYGYNRSMHHRDLMMKENKYKPVLAGNRPNPRYLGKEREIEVEYLESWVNLVSSSSGLEWVITAANKVDLWEKEQKKAMNYYGRNGAYAQVMKRGLGAVRHQVCPIVSAIDDFYGVTGTQHASEREQKMTIDFAKVLHENLVNTEDSEAKPRVS